MALGIQIAKFKFRQYLLRANSPNLMLAKLSRYNYGNYTFVYVASMSYFKIYSRLATLYLINFHKLYIV